MWLVAAQVNVGCHGVCAVRASRCSGRRSALAPEVVPAWVQRGAVAVMSQQYLGAESDLLADIRDADAAPPELEAAQRMVSLDMMGGVR